MHNLNKAKKNNGIIPVRFLKIVVAGIGAVGKTSFIHLLMKKRFNQDHHSSNILSINHLVSFQIPNDKVTWVFLDSELIAGYLQSMLLPQTPSKPKSQYHPMKQQRRKSLHCQSRLSYLPSHNQNHPSNNHLF